jgi:hypothetical protein
MFVVLQSNQRRKTDHETQYPDTCDEQLGSFRRHDARVRNRARHCDVTVQRDGAQVQDGGCAHPYVHSKPDFTPNVTEDPHLEYFPGGAERQNGESHHEIGYSQRHYEEVCDGAEFGAHEDRCDDQTVAHDHHHGDEK